MKFQKPKYYFSTRISLMVMLIATVIFAAASVFFYNAARERVTEEAKKEAMLSLDRVILRIDKELQSVETAVANNVWQVEHYRDRPDSLYTVLRRMIDANPVIVGSAIAFEPDFFPSKGYFFSPYVYRDGEKMKQKQLGNDNYEYHYMDWYEIPKLLDTPYWSEPYFDTGGNETIMTTYSLPLHNKDGNIFAIFTADISLEWLTKEVNSLQLYPGSHNFMIGRGGTYITHPDPKKVLTTTVFTYTQEVGDTTTVNAARRVIAGERGYVSRKGIDGSLVHNEHSDSYLFYAPISRNGWSLLTLCTYNDIFAGVEHIRNMMILICFVGVVILWVFCFWSMRRATRPLLSLAEATAGIAQGNLDAALPPMKQRHDELGMLYSSFGNMQSSLKAYIEELAVTTANKERIDSELRIASEIQMGMLPKTYPPFPERKEIDLYAKLIPAKEVGGDLYDFLLEGDMLYFTVGDVSGKGVPASLLMAVTRILFRTVSPRLKEPAAIVASINESINETNEAEMFVTIFLGRLNLKTGNLSYCNAGHNPPVVCMPGEEPSILPVIPNIPLGLFPAFDYKGQETVIRGGESLFVYTDGVTEAENRDKQFFSDEQLQKILKEMVGEDAKSTVDNLLTAVQKFADGEPQSDDLTMLCLKYMDRRESRDESRESGKNRELVLTNNRSEISRLTPFVASIGEELSLSADQTFNLNLALEEAVANIIDYAFTDGRTHTFSVKATNDDGTLTVTLTDDGIAFDPTAAKEADITKPAEERAIGGLGIFLIRQIMNEVRYERANGKNILILKKKIKS